MYRQTPRTNQRSEEIKVKHVWKVCLFLGVCCLLIYKVKSSLDEKKGFDESDVKGSLASGQSKSFVKLGRKVVHSRVEEMTVEDVEENKLEGDGLEDIEDQEKGSGGMAGGDAEVDQENSVNSMREGGEGEENENEEKDSEEINDEKESSVEETDHDGDDTSSHVAREENYKADDASSAVSHEIQMAAEDAEENKHEEDVLEDIKDQENGSGGMAGGDAEVDQENSGNSKREGGETDSEEINDQIEKESSVEETDREQHYKADDASSAVSHEIQMADTENGNEHDENENEQIDVVLEHGFEENTGEETDEGEKRKELEVEVGEMVKNDTEANVTYDETEENKGSAHHTEMREFESEYAPEILTEYTSAEDLNLQDTDLKKANYSTLNVDNSHSDSASTDPDDTINLEEIQQDSTDSSDSSDFSEEKDTEAVVTDLDTLNLQDTDLKKTNYSTLNVDNSHSDSASTDPDDTKNLEEIQQDSTDSSDSSDFSEEIDPEAVGTDLDTLPEIQTEGTKG